MSCLYMRRHCCFLDFDGELQKKVNGIYGAFTAHRMKECFYEICHMKAYRTQQKEFDDWIANARSCRIPEFEKGAQTYQNWRKEILNAFKYGIKNGKTSNSAVVFYMNRIKTRTNV